MIDIKKLGAVNSAKLVKFIETEYSSLGKSDREFAEVATKALGFPVSSAAVNHRRVALNIRSWQDTRKEENAKKADELRAQKLAKGRDRKLLERNKIKEVFVVEERVLIVQRLDMIVQRLDSLIDLWKPCLK